MSTTRKRTKKADLRVHSSKNDDNETSKQKRENDQGLTDYVPLSIVECGLYFVAWGTVVAYLMYTVYKVSDKYKHQLYPDNFREGWKIFGRKKDGSDMEWDFWLKFKWYILLSYGLHYLGGQIVSYFIPKFQSVFFLMFSLIFLFAIIGVLPILYLMVHCLVMYICALTGSVMLVWSASLVILVSLQFETLRQWQFQYLTSKQELSDFTLFVALMSILRCLSFSLEYCWQRTKQEKSSYSLLDLLTFNFYLPLFNNGPVMTFNNFHNQLNQSSRSLTKDEIINIAWGFVRTLFCYIFLEVYLHFIYSSALIQEVAIARGLSGWALSGIFYSQLHIFLTKYVVMYRLSGLFARLDGLDAPKAPRCVSTLYTFTDMWRSFDRGLNVWMKRYIYFPMGGSRKGIFRQFLASFVAFGFIWAWHGGSIDTIWWFVPNWLGVAIEGVVSVAIKHPMAIDIQERLPPRMRRRVHAMICVIPCTCLILSNMVFLIGPMAVKFYIQKIFYQDFPVSTLVCLGCLYLSIQTNIDLNYYKGSQR